jgi:transposase
LRSTGFVAPLVPDGPMTGEVFRAYVRQFLAPALEAGDVVVMDKLAAHKVAGVREAIEAAGASAMPLPAYPPSRRPVGPLASGAEFSLQVRHRPFPVTGSRPQACRHG